MNWRMATLTLLIAMASVTAGLAQQPICVDGSCDNSQASRIVRSPFRQDTRPVGNIVLDPLREQILVEDHQLDEPREAQAGDRFEVIFEESYVDDTVFVGTGKILAARFFHNGKSFYAFRYENGEVEGYYDHEGEGMKRMFLKAPLEFARITSRYTMNRFHPVQKRWKAHLGTDYAAPSGTPILATANGTVVAAAYNSANGNYVKIKHNGTYTTQYLHMSRIGKGVRNGSRVEQGQVIGYVGSTGLATGPHVCYRFWKNGRQVDPLKEPIQRADPLPRSLWSEFESGMKPHKAILDSLAKV